jgi:hypothetical protein
MTQRAGMLVQESLAMDEQPLGGDARRLEDLGHGDHGNVVGDERDEGRGNELPRSGEVGQRTHLPCATQPYVAPGPRRGGPMLRWGISPDR